MEKENLYIPKQGDYIKVIGNSCDIWLGIKDDHEWKTNCYACLCIYDDTTGEEVRKYYGSGLIMEDEEMKSLELANKEEIEIMDEGLREKGLRYDKETHSLVKL